MLPRRSCSWTSPQGELCLALAFLKSSEVAARICGAEKHLSTFCAPGFIVHVDHLRVARRCRRRTEVLCKTASGLLTKHPVCAVAHCWVLCVLSPLAKLAG